MLSLITEWVNKGRSLIVIPSKARFAIHQASREALALRTECKTRHILDIGQTLDRRVRGEVAGLLCFQSHCLTLRAECVSISTWYCGAEWKPPSAEAHDRQIAP